MTSQNSTLYVRDQATRRYRRAVPQEIVAVAQTAIDELFLRDSVSLQDPNTVYQFVVTKIAARDQEVFACLFLDNKHKVIAYEELFFGTIDSSAVHPRQVVKRALFWNAATVIFAHNHPSGDCSPSAADQNITLRLRDALKLIDIRVLDHIVIGATRYTSLARQGLL